MILNDHACIYGVQLTYILQYSILFIAIFVVFLFMYRVFQIQYLAYTIPTGYKKEF